MMSVFLGVKWLATPHARGCVMAHCRPLSNLIGYAVLGRNLALQVLPQALILAWNQQDEIPSAAASDQRAFMVDHGAESDVPAAA